jgi:DnaJ-class molecular chaperone
MRMYHCGECEGHGVVGQSPYNPEGQMCGQCDGSGFNNDGSTLYNLEDQINKTINEYIAEFTNGK